MDLFEIRPRLTLDGFDLTGPLGGTENRHWFKRVRSAAEYARHRAAMDSGGILRVYHPNGTLRAERVLAGTERNTLGTLSPIPRSSP